MEFRESLNANRFRRSQKHCCVLVLAVLFACRGLWADDAEITLGKDAPAADSDHLLYVVFDEERGAVRRLQLNRFQNEERGGPFTLLSAESPALLSFTLVLNGSETGWKLTQRTDREVRFQKVVEAGGVALEVEKRFALDPESYALSLSVVVRNPGDAEVRDFFYDLVSGNGLPLEAADRAGEQRVAVAAVPDEEGRVSLRTQGAFGIGADTDLSTDQTVFYWGAMNRYFASVVMPQPDDEGRRDWSSRRISAELLQDADGKFDDRNVAVVSETSKFDIPAGGEVVHEYRVYCGPKRRDALAEFQDEHLPLLIVHRNVMFLPVRYIAEPVTRVVNWLRGIVGDYGVALILVTFGIRVLMVPMTISQRRGTVLIQRLKPRVDALRREHGDDKKAFAEAQMQLFREQNFNPMAGCLTSLLTLALFLSAWQGLLHDFSLRHAELLWGTTWIHDLSSPDRLFKFGTSLPMLGRYFNLLPVIPVVFAAVALPLLADAKSEERKPRHTLMWAIVLAVLGYQLPAGSWVCILTFMAGNELERFAFPIRLGPSRLSQEESE